MTLDRLSQITEVGIQSGITLRNINVEGANVSGVVTATRLSVSQGFNVTGVVTATSFDGNVTGNINPNTLLVTGVSTFQASSHWGDGDVAYFGTDDDLLIFHNSTDSIIRDTGTGDLYIEGGNVIRMTNPTGIETYATFNQDASVELYYDGNKKFETTSGGAKVSGDLVVSGIITSGTSTITIDGPNNSITVGDSFIKSNAVGLGATTTAGRNAGVGTATGTIIYNSTTATVQVWTGARWGSVGENFIEATGGTISDYESGGIVYRAHIFTSSGTFTVNNAPAGSSVETLVVAGGGGGGSYPGNGAGGGGAGGLLEGSFPVVATPGSYAITIGAGGNTGSTGNGSGGSNTTITSPILTTITANGGGYGSGGNNAGGPGGSGGGAGGNNLTNAPATQTPYSPTLLGYGNQGGTASPCGMGGGGGGAGGAGVNGIVILL